MKIILVNYRYFISGGPERYMFNVKYLLEKNGHTVIPFSIKSRMNEPSEYENYFLEPVGDGNEVYFGEYNKKKISTVSKTFSRMFYSYEAKNKLETLISDVGPDIIYILHYQNKISISIFDAARKFNIPVVHRISDFGQICANALFFRQNKLDICERCLTGSKMNAVVNKCVYNSYLYSGIKVLSLYLQKFLHLAQKVDAFVVPSKFTLEKLKQSGLPENKLYHLPTFFNSQFGSQDDVSYGDFALYVGRIEAEKGLFTLIKAFSKTKYKLKIIGFSNSGYEDELKAYLKDTTHNIEFLGKKNFEEIKPFLVNCAFTIVPSEWYDNFPNTILESFAYKKGVVCSNIGSLTELVIDGSTGLLFRSKSEEDLIEKITLLFNDSKLCNFLGINAYMKLQNEFSENQHYQKLLSVFQSVLNSERRNK